MSTEVKTVDAVVYDPAKSYEWKPTDTFNFEGKEFGMTLNYLLGKREALLQELEVIALFERKLKAAVEEGKAVERYDPTLGKMS